MNRTIAIVQARIGSTRLPGKVLRPICGKTMLQRVVERLRMSETIDEVVIATSTAPGDESVADEGRRLSCPVFRGSERDVLDRYYKAARLQRAEQVVRVTADCPLIDAGVVDRVVRALREERNNADYASNVVWRSFPAGLDAEAFHFDTLERMWRRATSPAAREHVTVYIREKIGLFTTVDVVDERDRSHLRWTVDTQVDLDLVETIYRELHLDQTSHDYRHIAQYQAQRPALLALNQHIQQKPYWQAQQA